MMNETTRIEIAEYNAPFSRDRVAMWRESKEAVLGVKDMY
jgi:hypothetical protein